MNKIMGLSNKSTIKMTALGALFLVIFFSFCLGCVLSRTQECSAGTQSENKYFTNIVVEEGDTLWDVASEYMDEEHYESIYEYMAEIKDMNNMTSDNIYAGQNLVVTYYAVTAAQ